MQLCDAFDLPLLFLCDTPGMMVGPEAEKTALVRHVSRLFVTARTSTCRSSRSCSARATARRAGDGGRSFKAPLFTVAWPTGEFGGMGLEGAVKLGYRKELAALEDRRPARRSSTRWSRACTSTGRR
jgi:acetyl-CoA carboxylase carboxyltransferase component